MYPTFLYHPDLGARVFTDESEYDVAVAGGWVDTPAPVAPVKPEKTENSGETQDIPSDPRLVTRGQRSKETGR